MKVSSSTLGTVLAAIAATFGILTSGPTASAAAIVIHDRNSFNCVLDADEVPGFPEIAIPNTTVVIDASGKLHVTCYGSFPSDLSLSRGYVGAVVCNGDETYQDAPGKVVATPGGQILIQCVFAAPPDPE